MEEKTLKQTLEKMVSLSKEAEQILVEYVNSYGGEIDTSDENKDTIWAFVYDEILYGEEVDVVQWAKEHSTELLEVANQNHVTWSKADEVKINRIVSLLENLKVAENDILRKDINWLKSLRPQINVTDKELAQARKEAYNEALDKIEYHDDWPTFDDGWNAAIWYLKKRNTMPQNQWKPSEEQIKMLDEILNFAANHENPYWNYYILGTLNNLIRQLKNLKGE